MQQVGKEKKAEKMTNGIYSNMSIEYFSDIAEKEQATQAKDDKQK